MKNFYKDAEIYLTECIHPDYKKLRYLGLDTKADPNYLGSSVVLKWWMTYIGRRYFKKSVLETVSGTMSECCKVEQKYILDHNAVKDPNYLNMNGEKLRSSIEDKPISLGYAVKPKSYPCSEYIDKCLADLKDHLKLASSSKRKFASNILCVILYGFFKYDQEDFEYCKFSNYGPCTPSEVQDVLSALAAKSYIDFDSISVTIQDGLMEDIPPFINQDHFQVISID